MKGPPMTEGEWLALDTLSGVSPLSWLRGAPNERLMFLFLGAFLPHFMHGQFCPACRRLLPLLARQAEGGMTPDGWSTALRTEHPERGCPTRAVFRHVLAYLRGIVCPAEFWSQLCSTRAAVSARMQHTNPGHQFGAEWHREETARIDRLGVQLLKDLAGNPYRSIACAPEWRTDTVVAINRQMYELRDFSAMPILADALQDAGCDFDDILLHCRSEATHVCGCWVVELLRAKEDRAASMALA